jgi:tRNA nucleotidyltransferase (CCA-adding enzyme)
VLGASLTTGGESGRRFAKYLEYHRRLRPNLSGNDLIALGVHQGPTVGHILERLRNAWLDGEVSNADGELELAKKLINGLRED